MWRRWVCASEGCSTMNMGCHAACMWAHLYLTARSCTLGVAIGDHVDHHVEGGPLHKGASECGGLRC